MGLREKTDSKKNTNTAETFAHTPTSYQAPRHYHDDVEMDAIERLKSNILMLDDLQQRLAFMNNELELVLGSKKKY